MFLALKAMIARFIRRHNLPIYIVWEHPCYLSHVGMDPNTHMGGIRYQDGDPHVFGFYLSVARAIRAIERSKLWYNNYCIFYNLGSIRVTGFDVTFESESE